MSLLKKYAKKFNKHWDNKVVPDIRAWWKDNENEIGSALEDIVREGILAGSKPSEIVYRIKLWVKAFIKSKL